MRWLIEFSPLVPIWALFALGIAGLALVGLLLWRRSRGAVLRASALALLLLALANPNLRQEEREALADIVVAVVDDSSSQRLAGRMALTEKIREKLVGTLDSVTNLEVRWITSPGNDDAQDRDGTMLFADLSKVLSEVPLDRLAGVVLITDGQIHDLPARAADIGLKVPIHAFITGHDKEFDRRIEILRAPRFGLVGSVPTAEIRISETPAGGKGTAKLRILREGEAEELREVRIGETIKIPMRFPHAGTNIIELAIDGVPGELTLANNKAVLAAEGVRENLRVLLVSGEPHAGERVWRNLLKSDAAVDLVHFTILRPPEKQDGTPINQLSLIAFPTRELFSEKLDDFDLIIFDRYHRRGVLPLLYLDNVARYVEEGGAVLVASGARYASSTSLYRTPLSSILPAAPTGRVIEEAFRPTMSALGNRHPVTRGLTGAAVGKKAPSWGRWFRLIETAGAQGSVLMYGPKEAPLLVLDRRAEGRVALLLSDHAWLWARGFDGGGPHTALLRRLAHWLMKEPDLEEEVLRATGRGNEIIIERRSTRDKVDPVEVTRPTGEKEIVELEAAASGIWRKSLKAREQGVYRLTAGDLTAVTHLGTLNAREFERLTASDEALEPLLKETGGGSFWIKAGASDIDLPRIVMLRSGPVLHGSDWLGLKKRDAYEVHGLRLIPLFAGLAALALLLGAISLTWFREGR